MNDRANRPAQRVSVLMQRRVLQNRWQSEAWEPAGVQLVDDSTDRGADAGAAAPAELAEGQWIYPGFEVSLNRTEAEGYFHNVSTATPMVFVSWEMEDGRAVPKFVTASYDEASRWMDGGANVDPVPMPEAMAGWVRAFVAANYRPQPKKRIKPQSFLSPKDRARS